MISSCLVVLLALSGSHRLVGAPAQPGRETAAPVAALVGDWQLNVGRTHYGPGVDRRSNERFTCTSRRQLLACTIRSVRADGRVVAASFEAAGDGAASPVTGMPDIDEIRLRSTGDGVVDAVFSLRSRPVFAYRAYRAADGGSLTIVSVDPVSTAILNTVVVYDRRGR